MPRAAIHTLTWSPEQATYMLFTQDHQDHLLLQDDDITWSVWLATHTSFSFQGQHGHLTLLKETRSRGGEGYWYAYRRQGKRKMKHYIGRSADLTLARLEVIAQTLEALASQTPPTIEEPSHKLTMRTRFTSLEDAKPLATEPTIYPSEQLPQQTPLLMPKLRLPRLPSSLIPRQRLLTRLDAALERKLTLLTAPAGFGKTTLVRQWIDKQRTHGQFSPAVPPLGVAWVSLDPEDDDPVRFWRYILTACQTFQNGLGHSALVQLSMHYRSSFVLSSLKAMLTTFLNEATQLVERHVLVLEDYHVIAAPLIHESLAFLLDHLPATLHLVIISRSEPPLPLARWRAKDDLQEVSAPDLRFSQEEMTAFLQQALSFSLSSQLIMQIETHTEGWITGLRLLTLALQGPNSPQEIEHVLATFTGSHRYLLDYFAIEVLSAQSETLQTFLLQTSGLSRMTASLCDAVTGNNDSAQLLADMERAGLFLQSLDGDEPWYRYHVLFAEAMQAEARHRLGEDALRSCLSRASAWYEQHGMFAEAVEAELQSGEWTRAATLIEKYFEKQIITENHELSTLLRWLESLPEQVLKKHPTLCLAYAMAHLFTSDRSAPTTMKLIQVPLDLAERHWRAEDNRSKIGEVLALRSHALWWQGDMALAFAAARQALELAPELEMQWRSFSTFMIGEEALLAGKPDAARQMTLEAQALFTTIGNTFGARATISLLGEIDAQRGDLHQAVQYYRQELAEAAEDPFDQMEAQLGLARLSYEWNNLKAAEQAAREVLEFGTRYRNEIGKYYTEAFLLVPASLVLARVLHADGKITQGQQSLQELLVLTQERRWPLLHREILAVQARLWLAESDLPAVQRWLATVTQLGDDFRVVQQEREALIIARLLIAQGETTNALHLLEHWQRETQGQKRTRSELEIQIIMALAHFTHNCQLQATQILKEVLRRAQIENYQRLFLDEGEPLIALLQAVLLDLREKPLASYARSLLLASTSPQTVQRIFSHLAPTLPIEPLSLQELRVLRLLATGRSNPEIAQELIVSINTVKTQVQSIYRKLNVNNRWEAREAAHRLNLL